MELLLGDRRVHRIGLGAMRLALGGSVRDPESAVAVLRRAVELGVNHIDTAGTYGFGELHAHELIRRALWPYPDDLVIASKVTVPTEAEAGQLRGLVEQDLRRLGVDHLDLVYLRVGGMAEAGGEPLGARFTALAELRDEGLIRQVGVSHVDAAQLAEAQAIAPVTAVQNHFNVQHRADTEVLTRCEKDDIAYVPYFPLGGGRADLGTLAGIASRHGATPAQIALAWLLTTSPTTIAIPGASTVAHVTENVAATDIHLTTEDLTELSGKEAA